MLRLGGGDPRGPRLPGSRHQLHRRRQVRLDARRRLHHLGQRQHIQSRGQSRVQLRQGAAHGGGGERGRLPGVRGRQPARLRQQRRQHRAPQDRRQALLHLQRHGPLRRRHEARGHRLRLRLRIHLAVVADTHPEDPDHAVHQPDTGDADHAVHDPYNAIHDDADVPGVHRDHAWLDSRDAGDPGHHAVLLLQWRRRAARAGGVG